MRSQWESKLLDTLKRMASPGDETFAVGSVDLVRDLVQRGWL